MDTATHGRKCICFNGAVLQTRSRDEATSAKSETSASLQARAWGTATQKIFQNWPTELIDFPQATPFPKSRVILDHKVFRLVPRRCRATSLRGRLVAHNVQWLGSNLRCDRIPGDLVAEGGGFGRGVASPYRIDSSAGLTILPRSHAGHAYKRVCFGVSTTHRNMDLHHRITLSIGAGEVACLPAC
jgi:hypothetical protein